MDVVRDKAGALALTAVSAYLAAVSSSEATDCGSTRKSLRAPVSFGFDASLLGSRDDELHRRLNVD